MNKNHISVVFLGATGAVGSIALQKTCAFKEVNRILLLGRRKMDYVTLPHVEQQMIDIFDVSGYQSYIRDVDVAICTLGVGEPTKASQADFIRIDKMAVLDFAKVCKQAGVKHFQLLSAVGVSSTSINFFLKTKGELVDALEKMNFDRLSIFQPSMIITPKNRYGFSQAVILKIWPLLSPLFFGGLKKYRGIDVSILGEAIANNMKTDNSGSEKLQWKDFMNLKNNRA